MYPVTSYATLKKAAANVNRAAGRLSGEQHRLIVQSCDEILDGLHGNMFPLHVWMTGSGTQFNMNVNEVIANRCSQIAGTRLGSKTPVHPNDHVNMSQSSNDSFPTAMNIAAAVNVKSRLLPAVTALRNAITAKSEEWKNIVKIGRTHMQDATPLTLGQEWSGYAAMLGDCADRIEDALEGVYELALGGTAVGTGINAAPGFDKAAAAEIARLTQLPFVSAPNKFAVQGAHDALVHLSGSLRTLSVSLYKIANDIRLMSCGPRAGFAELIIPANEPGSSIMPGKVNPTQAEALSMLAVQVMAMIEKATNANLFSAVRVDGIFDEVRTRTVQRQARPFPPLTEATKHQAEKVFTDVQGTLAGFRTPLYAQGIGVAGFHLHFLRQDKQAGGHALDYRLRGGKVQICTVHDLQVELPTSAEFLKTNFEDQALSEKIKASEG